MDNLIKESAFLEFYLTATPKQQAILSKHLTQEQTLVLLEILYNLLHLKHSERDLDFYNKKKAFLKKFEKKKSFRVRKKLLTSRIRTVLKIINHFKSKLLDLIR